MEHLSQSDVVKAGISKAGDLLAWIDRKLHRIELKGDHRHRIPAQLFDLALEHAAGILQLVAAKNYASAFALVRCEFECFVRGAWLHHRATDTEIEAFVQKDEIKPKMWELIEALEAAPPFQDKLLSSVKDTAWKAMNGYTHGGIHQVSHRLQGDYIEPSFEDEAILEVIQFAATMALIALGEIAAMAGQNNLVEEAQAMMDSGASTVLPAPPQAGAAS